jgi:hypothetical protein
MLNGALVHFIEMLQQDAPANAGWAPCLQPELTLGKRKDLDRIKGDLKALVPHG